MRCQEKQREKTRPCLTTPTPTDGAAAAAAASEKSDWKSGISYSSHGDILPICHAVCFDFDTFTN